MGWCLTGIVALVAVFVLIELLCQGPRADEG